VSQAEVVFDRLSSALEFAGDYRAFVNEVEPLVRAVEPELSVERGSIDVLFDETPTASNLAMAVDEVDRDARRVVAAFERGVRPEHLRGRGVRLVPPGRGLHVERADPGSLDVVLVLGGLYQAITSQPLSFALNLAALLGYGKATLRAMNPRRRRPAREITIRLPVLPKGEHHAIEPGDQATPELPSGEGAHVEVPSSYSSVHIRMTSSDGTSIEVDCET
jgi:hypothetical protein